VIEGYVHMLCIAGPKVPYVKEQLELRGYDVYVGEGVDWSDARQVTFSSPLREIDLDFLRPDILPPRETS